jgi:serpin B
MDTIRRLLIVLVVCATIAAACGDGDAAPTTANPPAADPTTTDPGSTSTVLNYDPNAAFIRADVARVTATNVTDAELAALVAANSAFAFDLFHAAAAEGNLIYSPNSVAAALTMTLAGARGTTAEEMRTVLNLEVLEARVHAARNELDLRVNTVPESPEGDDRAPFTIRTANSIWGQPGYPFLDAFLELLATEYDAGLRLADFAADPEAARVAINDWVEEATEGRIVDLIPSGALDPMTRLVLVNAIWFKASWDEQFSAELTRDLPFVLLDGTAIDVPMMQSNDRRLRFAEYGDYVAVSIPYTGDASMLVILPDSGRFAETVAAFDATELAALDDQLAARLVNLKLPSFEVRSEIGLNTLLRTLGMETAFTPPPGPGSADFTGMTETPELFISDVIHQAFIKVDEEGTEAAAATAVIMRATSAPIDEPLEVTIDRPFMFLIRHDSTGEILFMGQVTDPSAQ